VNDLSFEVEGGEIFGLIGPNGSGKTTTIRLLSCLLSPTSGRAKVAGYEIGEDPVKVRERVGVLTENPSLYERLTADENLQFYAAAYGIHDASERADRIRELLEMFELWDRRNDKVGTYSKGMRQKLAIARAIVHRPEVLFLDEPTSGLDPKASRDIRDLMATMSRQESRTILLCTHNLDDAERLCNEVMIIRKGSMVEMGSLDHIKGLMRGTPILRLVVDNPSQNLVRAAESVDGVKDVRIDGKRLDVELEGGEDPTPLIVRAVVDSGGFVRTVNLLRPSLEDAYLELVKEVGE
jgi:ABC-2 type transport system ATP-binding protein